MFFVLTEAVRNPADLTPVYAPGEILTQDAVAYLSEGMCIDTFDCIACINEQAALATQKRLLADRDCSDWLPDHAVSPELRKARETYAKGLEQFRQVLNNKVIFDGLAAEVVKFTQWDIDRHLGITNPD